MIQAARRLYVTPGQHLTLGQVVELNKRFLEAYVVFKDEPRVQKLQRDVLKYNRVLRDLGLRDHQVCVNTNLAAVNLRPTRFQAHAKPAGKHLVYYVTELHC
jgi:hypothetical protein